MEENALGDGESDETLAWRMGRDEAAWRFFRQNLGAPRFVCAPMVRGSERAFRELAKAHGCELAYSPMLDAAELVQFAKRRPLSEASHRGGDNIAGFDIGEEERGQVVVQLAGRDPATMVAAGLLVQDVAAAVCVNLGCPQSRALSCGFGVALLHDPEVACAVFRAMTKALRIPVFCKIRVLEAGREATVALALALESTGISLLTVHGRTPRAKFDGVVDIGTAAAVARALRVPVLFNGGIKSRDQAVALLEDENNGFAGVMVASALLANPSLFSAVDEQRPGGIDFQGAIDLAFEYLEFTVRFPPPGPMYTQLHFRHLFRAYSNGGRSRDNKSDKDNSDDDGKPTEAKRLWAAVSISWMRTSYQFMALLRLIALQAGLKPPDLSLYLRDPLPASLGELRRCPHEVALEKKQENLPIGIGIDIGLFNSADSY